MLKKNLKTMVNQIILINECDFMLLVNNLWYSMFFRVAIKVLKFQDMIQPGVVPTTESSMWVRHMQSLGYKLVVVSVQRTKGHWKQNVWGICPLFCQVNFLDICVHVQLKTNFVFILFGFFFNFPIQILKSQLSHYFCRNLIFSSKSIANSNGLYHTCLLDTAMVEIDTCIDDNYFWLTYFLEMIFLNLMFVPLF